MRKEAGTFGYTTQGLWDVWLKILPSLGQIQQSLMSLVVLLPITKQPNSSIFNSMLCPVNFKPNSLMQVLLTLISSLLNLISSLIIPDLVSIFHYIYNLNFQILRMLIYNKFFDCFRFRKPVNGLLWSRRGALKLR